VGRISAQIDDLHRRHYGAMSGHFGLLEAVEDEAVFAALLETAETWLRSQGAEQVTGPFGLSINQESGLLVQGFDTPPMLMMPHGRPWYDGMLQQCGYAPARDLYAYWIKVHFDRPDTMLTLLKRYSKRVHLRPLNRRRLKQDLRIIRDLFNDAWANNWGFVPMTEAEIDDLGTSLRLFVPDDFVYIAEVDGKPAAFIVGLPNLHESFRRMDGSLFPTGIFKLIGDMRHNRISTGRIPLMGVRREWQNTPFGMALAFMVINAIRTPLYDKGIHEVEMSWILQDNKGMRSILELIGSRHYKTYRVYEKRLEPQQ
ncbi:MAG: N-acetyltransferase, partial [Gammaproteobacteria bacterium]